MFVKLFVGMLDGTLVSRGPWQALVTFQQMLLLADPVGVVDMTPEAISRRTTIPLEIIRTGIETLEQPDPESRSPAEDGRRIVRLSDSRSWGWQIVNYLQYREIRDEEHRREYQREWARQARAKKIAGIDNVNSVDTASTGVDTSSTTSTASTTVDPSRSRSRRKENPMFTADAANGFDEFWSAYPRKQGKLDAQKAWIKLNLDDTLRAKIVAAVGRSRDTEGWRKDGGKFVPLPATYLNGRRWEDETAPGADTASWREI